MNWHRPLLRSAMGAALLGAALLVGGTASAFADTPSPDPIIVQPFAADSGPRCPVGTVRGQLGWHRGPTTTRPLVDVKGVLSDPVTYVAPCVDDSRFTIVTFRATLNGVVVATTIQRVDNGKLAFAFQLSSTKGIDTVLVQVCRRSVPSVPLDYCGRVQTYKAPITIAS